MTADKRPVCVHNGSGVRMKPRKNDVSIKYGKESVLNGDVYECLECGNQIVCRFGDKWQPEDDDFRDQLPEVQEQGALDGGVDRARI